MSYSRFPRVVLQSGLLWSPPRFCSTWPWNSFSWQKDWKLSSLWNRLCNIWMVFYEEWPASTRLMYAKQVKRWLSGTLLLKGLYVVWGRPKQSQSGTTNSHGLHLTFYSTRLMALEKLFSPAGQVQSLPLVGSLCEHRQPKSTILPAGFTIGYHGIGLHIWVFMTGTKLSVVSAAIHWRHWWLGHNSLAELSFS